MTCRAAIIDQFEDAADGVRVVSDFILPPLGDTDVEIAVVAAGVNPVDCLVRQGYGDPLLRRYGAPGFPRVLGCDVAGIVSAVGAGVDRFRVGDRVWAAVPPWRQGAYAERVRLPADWVAHAPTRIPLRDAAALPYAGRVVWQALAESAGLHRVRGQRLFVHAGAGGVGSIAIQLAVAWGHEIGSTCSTGNVSFLRELGATQVVDYTREQFDQVCRDYDVVFNTLAPDPPRWDERPHLRILRRGGTYVTLITPVMHLATLLGARPGLVLAGGLYWSTALWQRAVHARRYHWILFQPDGRTLAELASYVDDGLLRPVIRSRYPLEQVAAAQQDCERGHGRGKVMIDIGDEEALLADPASANRGEQ
ncbi:MAG: hypothetical protein D6761_03575 [Candidatus Dadabacteria bacterium]|nr:MAG: hypothetical protein D6761_03575 [Candidatus Dadabacteria bacterium]